MAYSCTCEKSPKEKKPPSRTTRNITKPPQERTIKAEKKQVKLKNTQWEIDVKPRSKKWKAYRDILTFTDRRVESERFKSQGYNASNYTLRVVSAGAASWETMQARSGGDTIFWRADIREGKMSGVIIRRAGNENQELRFVSVSSKTIQPPPEAVKSP